MVYLQGISGLHPAVGPLFIQGREIEKSASHIPPAPQSTLPTTAKVFLRGLDLR